MKRYKWQVFMGLSLIVISGALYFAHYRIFGDLQHIFIYLLGDIAFLPIEVLLVTLIINQLLSAREKRSLLKKLNMVIGVFFSDVGSDLLKLLAGFDPSIDKIRNDLLVRDDWTGKQFSEVSKKLKNYVYIAGSQRSDLNELRSFLTGRRNMLLMLLQNPNLLEHDSFTDLLWAVFHLTEELTNRGSLEGLPGADYEHISIDIRKAYSLLIAEWLNYMQHLRDEYPYFFSLAMRTNPFDPQASPVVQPVNG